MEAQQFCIYKGKVMLNRTFAHLRRRSYLLALPLLFMLVISIAFLPKNVRASSTISSYNAPTWWAKYQILLKGNTGSAATSQAFSVGSNIDVSNEDTPQSETSITVNPTNPRILVGGSNEIVRLPMRGYFSSDGGKSWGE